MKQLAAIVIVAVAITASTRGARADFSVESYTLDLNGWMDNYERNLIQDRVVLGSRSSGGKQHSTVVPKRAARMPAVLAAQKPADQRAAVEQHYAEMLAGYEQVERRLKLPARDVAGAFALLVCASYAAYRERDLPDEALPAAAKQLRAALGSSPGFQKMTMAQKQDMYEGLAIAGMTLAISAANAKDPATKKTVSDLGKSYLAAFVDPDHIAITAQGISAAK